MSNGSVQSGDERQQVIIDTLVGEFSEAMAMNPSAFRRRFRKMAENPFAFYRGSDCIFYVDVAELEDRWANEKTGRVWLQGDLHAENFGTYMDSEGRLVFDVNDFDEAYLGHFTWDIKRLAASLSLIGWTKAIPGHEVARLIDTYTRAYVDQVRYFTTSDHDPEWSLRLDNTSGSVRDTLIGAQLSSQTEMLNELCELEGTTRRFRRGSTVREIYGEERDRVDDAYLRYLESIPESQRGRNINYEIKDIVGNYGFGVGSVGLPGYTVLIEGPSEALEDDIVLSVKQAKVAAPTRAVPDPEVRDYFTDDGHRTAVSQRALQAHADPFLGHTTLDGVGYVVDQLSPYEAELEWDDLAEPEEMKRVLDYLGRATAKIHCVADADSDQSLVNFQVEDAIVEVIDDREDEFVSDMVEFGSSYGETVRNDHELFVEAFRHDKIPGASPT